MLIAKRMRVLLLYDECPLLWYLLTSFLLYVRGALVSVVALKPDATGHSRWRNLLLGVVTVDLDFDDGPQPRKGSVH
jgi:hypothetical protein